MFHLTDEERAQIPARPRPTHGGSSEAKRIARQAWGAVPACHICGALPSVNAIGNANLAWHHFDDSLPRAVVGLCPSCHRSVHQGLIAEPVTGRWWPNVHGLTRPEMEREARRYAAELVTPARRPYAAREGLLTERLHLLAVEIGALVPCGAGKGRRFVRA
jgi:hypothetical protein